MADDETKVKIVMDETQARVVSEALELYSRVHLGQLDELPRVTRRAYIDEKTGQKVDMRTVVYYIECLKNALFPELDKNEYYGIYSDKISDRAKISFDVYQCLRNALAWHFTPDGGITVDFDEPLAVSQHPLPDVSVSTKKLTIFED